MHYGLRARSIQLRPLNRFIYFLKCRDFTDLKSTGVVWCCRIETVTLNSSIYAYNCLTFQTNNMNDNKTAFLNRQCCFWANGTFTYAVSRWEYVDVVVVVVVLFVCLFVCFFETMHLNLRYAHTVRNSTTSENASNHKNIHITTFWNKWKWNYTQWNLYTSSK